MPLSDYQMFYDKAMASLRPGMDAETANYKSALADQGILSSTGGQGAIQSARQNYLAKANQSAMDESYRQQGLAENQRQYDSGAALKVWEMLNARALGWKSMVPSSKVKLPDQLKGFKNLSANSFLAPKYSPGGMTGDPKENEYMAMVDAPKGKTQFEMQLDASNADNAANRAIQSAYLKLAQDKANQEKDAADPWANITAAAFQNATNDIDPTTKGFQAQAFPTQLMAAAQGTYGIDVLGEAKGGNEKAIAVVKMMYPQTWRQKLGLEGAPNNMSLQERLATPTFAAHQVQPAQYQQSYPGFVKNIEGWAGNGALAPNASVADKLGLYANPINLIGGTAKTLWEELTRPR